MSDNEQKARSNVATWGCAFLLVVILAIVGGSVFQSCQHEKQSQNIAKQL